MTHYLIELALWIFAAYFAGCLIGYVLRKMFGRTETATPAQPESAPADVAAPPVAAAASEPPAPPSMAPAPVTRMERPRGLAEPRAGKPDDLQRISGIGPKNEKILHSLGFFHFDQIAVWSAEQVAWVDDHLRFNGRITREHWIEQAELLARGAEDEFAARFGPKR